MFDASRIDIYDYLYNLFYDVVTKNVYSMNEPQELTKSDVSDGFLVIRVGNFNDESEFYCQTYGWARCYVTAYIPTISRGRLDYDAYRVYEDGINNVIYGASQATDGKYHILLDSVLSTDGMEINNANNTYFMFGKSFIVDIDRQE